MNERRYRTDAVLLLRRAQNGDLAARDILTAVLTLLIRRFLERRIGQRWTGDELLRDAVREVSDRISDSLARCQAESDDQLVVWTLGIAHTVMCTYLRQARGPAVLRFSTELERQLDRSVLHHSESEVSPPVDALLLDMLLEAYMALPEDVSLQLWLRMTGRISWEALAEEFATTRKGAQRNFRYAWEAFVAEIHRRMQSLPARERAQVLSRLRVNTGQTGKLWLPSDSARFRMYPDAVDRNPGDEVRIKRQYAPVVFAFLWYLGWLNRCLRSVARKEHQEAFRTLSATIVANALRC